MPPIGANIFANADVGPVSAMGGAGATAAFGPLSSDSAGGNLHPLHPSHSFGASFWIGVGALVVLWWLRSQLPA